MLLELARIMQEFASFFALFNYITMRAILSALTALALTLMLGPWVIDRLARLKGGGQPIRSDGPATHFVKAGTPTMGGALILLTITLSTLLWGDLRNRYVWVLLFVLISFGAIGWYDDWIKIVKRDGNGIKARHKYALQSLFGLAAALFLYYTADVAAATTLYLPLLKNVAIPMGLGFVVLAYFWIVGFSNAVNLTDGLDGLAIMPTVLVAVARHLRLCLGQRRVLAVPADSGYPRCWRAEHFLCRHRRRGPRLPVVQHVSGHGLHG